MSRVSPFILGMLLGASMALSLSTSQPRKTAPSHVAEVGTSVPAPDAHRVDMDCERLEAAHTRWQSADERARELSKKSEGALALAILSDHDDATHYARAKRFQEQAHRARASASRALRHLDGVRTRNADKGKRCVY